MKKQKGIGTGTRATTENNRLQYATTPIEVTHCSNSQTPEVTGAFSMILAQMPELLYQQISLAKRYTARAGVLCA